MIVWLKEQYFATLFICFAGVLGLYSAYAFLQEELLADKSLELNTNFVLAVQNIIAIVIAASIIIICDMGSLFGALNGGAIWVGVLQFSTMYCSNYSLKYVSFPFMALAKSAKILPVIVAGYFRGVYTLTRSQIVIAITISSGLVIFNSGKMKGIESDAGNYIGVGLVLLSLAFDGYSNT